jgi:hypothetical protein
MIYADQRWIGNRRIGHFARMSGVQDPLRREQMAHNHIYRGECEICL